MPAIASATAVSSSIGNRASPFAAMRPGTVQAEDRAVLQDDILVAVLDCRHRQVVGREQVSAVAQAVYLGNDFGQGAFSNGLTGRGTASMMRFRCHFK